MQSDKVLIVKIKKDNKMFVRLMMVLNILNHEKGRFLNKILSTTLYKVYHQTVPKLATTILSIWSKVVFESQRSGGGGISDCSIKLDKLMSLYIDLVNFNITLQNTITINLKAENYNY